MRVLSTTQGNGPKRRHYVPESQHMALCGFMPSFGGKWAPAPKTSRVCRECHRLKRINQGIDYGRARSV